METVSEIVIDLSSQTLCLRRDGRDVSCYPVSTSAVGVGTEPGSNRTPTGRFRVARMIGEGSPVGTVFRGRVPVGLWCPGDCSEEDLITTRILWLDGLDPENANTFSRYIYIHGTNHEEKLGSPCSHGCIRMRNADIVNLFSFVTVGTRVEILSSVLT